jgi:sarcosine oxidase gamma subunit
MPPWSAPAVVHELAMLVAPLLIASPFARRERWGSAVVVLSPEERRVTSRGDFAGWLAANALHAQARECSARRVPPGHVLVWISADTAEAAIARFVVLDLAAAARAALACA